MSRSINRHLTVALLVAVSAAASTPGSAAIAAVGIGTTSVASAFGVAQSGGVPVLVSTDWVAAHLDDPNVLLVHVAMLERRPLQAFLPGAVALDYHSIEDSDALAVELPPVDQLEAAFEAVGVSDDKHVVLYGGGAAHIAARAFVSLDYLSHPRVSVMDGGIEAWIDEGRPTTAEPATPPAGDFTPVINPDVLADAAWIAARLDDPRIALIDARPASQFAGPSNRGLREGHIPGAGNIYFVELLESEAIPRLRPRNEVEAMFAEAGFTAGATVVSYCQIGMRASYNYLIARHLGYDVKFYDGSWQEWGADESLPAETGSGR